MDALRQDVRYAIRALLNRPWFSALAVLTLAIGIGVNTVAYSAINALLGKPMRFAGARELGWIQTTGGKGPYKQTALPDYLDLVRENRTFDAIIAEARIPLSMQTGGADTSTVLGRGSVEQGPSPCPGSVRCHKTGGGGGGNGGLTDDSIGGG